MHKLNRMWSLGGMRLTGYTNTAQAAYGGAMMPHSTFGSGAATWATSPGSSSITARSPTRKSVVSYTTRSLGMWLSAAHMLMDADGDERKAVADGTNSLDETWNIV